MLNSRTLRSALFIFAGICLLVVGFYQFENWRGKQNWERKVAGIQERGLKIDWRAFVPEAISDERNLNQAPVIAYWNQDRPGQDLKTPIPWKDEWGPEDSLIEQSATLRSEISEEGGLDDIEAFTKQLEPYQKLLAEIRAACRERPEARMDGDYLADPFQSPMPSFMAVRTYSTLLWADALLRIENGEPEFALENVHAMRRLCRLNPKPYFLVDAMIEVVVMKNFVIPVYTAGLRTGVFSDQQIQSILRNCMDYDSLRLMESTFEAEIAAGITFAEKSINGELNINIPELLDLDSDWGRFHLIGKIIPDGWLWIMFSRHIYYSSYQLDIYDADKRRIDPAMSYEVKNTYERIITEAKFFNLLAAMAIPAYEKIWEQTILLQLQNDMCGIAFALELHKRAHGAFPTSLSELSPDIVSRVSTDPLTGAPYFYEPVNDDYRLWSVGADLKNDNGHNNQDNPKDVVWPLSSKIRAARPWQCGQATVTPYNIETASPSPDETITIHFIDESIAVIARNVAELFDLDLVIPEELESLKTSIKLKSVSWRKLFSILLESEGYTWYLDDSVVRIVSFAKAEEVFSDEVALITQLDLDEHMALLEPMIQDGMLTAIGTCEDSTHIHLRAKKRHAIELKRLIESIGRTEETSPNPSNK